MASVMTVPPVPTRTSRKPSSRRRKDLKAVVNFSDTETAASADAATTGNRGRQPAARLATTLSEGLPLSAQLGPESGNRRPVVGESEGARIAAQVGKREQLSATGRNAANPFRNCCFVLPN